MVSCAKALHLAAPGRSGRRRLRSGRLESPGGEEPRRRRVVRCKPFLGRSRACTAIQWPAESLPTAEFDGNDAFESSISHCLSITSIKFVYHL